MIRFLNLRYLRRQPARSALAAVAMAAAVSMALGVLVSYVSIDASLTGLTDQVYAGAPLAVLGAEAHGGLEEATVAKVAATPGVKAAVPVIQTVAMALGPHLDEPVLVLGVDCSVQALVGSFGCSPSQLAALADQATPVTSDALRHQAGPTSTLRTDIGLVPLGSALSLPQLDGLNRGRVVVFPLAQAQRLFLRPGRVDAIAVVPSSRADVPALRQRLQAELGSQDSVITSSGGEAGAVTGSLGSEMPLLVLVALGALCLGGSLVFNVTALALEERRRDLAIAGAVGASARRIRRAALSEAATIGALGGLAGVGLAAWVAEFFLGTFSGIAERIFGAVLALHFPLVALPLGVVGGAGVASLAALGPVRKVTSDSLVTEIHQRGGPVAEPTGARVATGVVHTLVGLLGVFLAWTTRLDGGSRPWQLPVAYLAVLLATGGFFGSVVSWAPLLLAGTRRMLERLGRLSGTAWLTLASVSRRPRRAGVMALAVASAVGFGAGLASFIPATQAALTDTYDHVAAGRVYVSPLGIINTADIDSKLSPATVTRIAHLPGVASVDADYYSVTFADGGRSVVTVHAIQGRDYGFRLFSGATPAVVLARGETMIGPGLARERRLQPGSVLRLATVEGVVSLRVGGIWEDPDNSGTSATLSAPLMQRLLGPLPPTEVWVQPAPGVSTAALASAIRAARLGPDLRIYTPAEYTAATVSGIGVFVAPFWILQRLLLAVAFVATAATLILIGVQRRREQALLGAVGLGRRGIARMVLAEGMVAGLAGALLGVVAGLALTLTLVLAGGVLFGAEPPFQFAPLQALLYLLLGLVIVGVATLWPARRTSRLSVVEALRYE